MLFLYTGGKNCTLKVKQKLATVFMIGSNTATILWLSSKRNLLVLFDERRRNDEVISLAGSGKRNSKKYGQQNTYDITILHIIIIYKNER